MNLDIRSEGEGKTIRRKYRIVSLLNFNEVSRGIVLHKEVMAKDNMYRQGAVLDDGVMRLKGHILSAWLAGGGKQLNPPDAAVVEITK